MAAYYIPETILSALTKKLYLIGQLWSGLFLGQASSSLQDPSGFCKDPTSKLNRDMLGTTMTASLRVALISAIALQGYTVFDSLPWWEGGSFRGFLLGLPCCSSHQQVQCVSYSNHHICQSQLYIGGLGKWVPAEFTHQVDPDFG